MPASARRERYAHRARWRLVPRSVHLLPANGSRTALVSDRQVRRLAKPSPARLNRDSSTHDLPRLFSPAEATEILRRLGLTEMTECELHTSAYRRQIPFHLDRRRIRFTTSDLREIVERHKQRPKPIKATTLQSGRRRPRRSQAGKALLLVAAFVASPMSAVVPGGQP